MKDLSSFDMLRMLERGLPDGYHISAIGMNLLDGDEAEVELRIRRGKKVEELAKGKDAKVNKKIQDYFETENDVKESQKKHEAEWRLLLGVE